MPHQCGLPDALTTDKTVIEATALMATALASQIKLVGDLIQYATTIRQYQEPEGTTSRYKPAPSASL
ncbi:hypothetical protein GFC06_22950 [Citrobacter braakii]|nr:hypothetical protein GFC06_22950 [Citrobacter braakii]